jgi:hypothetical protein
MLQAGRSWVRFPMKSLDFSIYLSFQPHCSPGIESASNRNGKGKGKKGTRNLPGGKGWPAREADNLTAICEPAV